MQRWLAISMVLSSTLVACGGGAPDTETAPAPVPDRPAVNTTAAAQAALEPVHELGTALQWHLAWRWLEAERIEAEQEAEEVAASQGSQEPASLAAASSPPAQASSAVAYFAPGSPCVVEHHDGFPFCGAPIPWSTPCAIPAYICERESLGWVNVLNAQTEDAAGKYQFLLSSWNAYAPQAGYPEWAGGTAALAPETVQDAVAAWLWNTPGGPCHWSAC